jgi:hypothetical protein
VGLGLALGSAAAGTDAHAQAQVAPRPAPPVQAPLVFVVDPKFGMEAGIRTFDSLARVLFRYDEPLAPFLAFDQHRTPGKIAAVALRIGQLVLLDEPLAELTSTSIHEVFGHGSRAREFGRASKFDFSLPGVYCAVLDSGDCSSHAAATADAGDNRDRDLLRVAGGLEANLLTAYWIDLRAVQARGWVHEGDLLVYAASKLAYFPTFLSSKLDRAGAVGLPSNDVDQYVTLLQDRFNLPLAEDRHRISSRLRTAYLWNFADPMLWYSAYGVFYRGVGLGERWTKAPLPTIGKTTFYAAPRFGLSPFGAEHYVDVFLGRGTSAVALYGRVGSSGLASYTGAGIRAIGVRVHDRLALGGELDVWSQPETLLEQRAVYERPQIRGFNAALSGDLRLIGSLGITGKLAYKTRGFLTGQPVDDGVYGYVGASIALDREATAQR